MNRLGATTPLDRGTVTSGHRHNGDGAAESSVVADTAAPDTREGAYTPSRVYKRRFDHDECQALYATGEWTQKQLAEKYGVTISAISQIADPVKAASYRAKHAIWQSSGTCEECGAICSRHHNTKAGRIRQICRACSIEARITTVRPDTLRCGSCKQWLPDDAFSRRTGASPYRRGRNRHCTQCQTRARSDYRARHKTPCTHCGTPINYEGRAKKQGKPPECRNCYHKRVQGQLPWPTEKQATNHPKCTCNTPTIYYSPEGAKGHCTCGAL